eukprot:symbB.v1.2.017998.t1/scaffold1419.1/size119806/10
MANKTLSQTVLYQTHCKIELTTVMREPGMESGNAEVELSRHWMPGTCAGSTCVVSCVVSLGGLLCSASMMNRFRCPSDPMTRPRPRYWAMLQGLFTRDPFQAFYPFILPHIQTWQQEKAEQAAAFQELQDEVQTLESLGTMPQYFCACHAFCQALLRYASLRPSGKVMSQDLSGSLLADSLKSEIVRRVERDAMEAREEVNRVVESTLRQIPPQIRHLEARKAIEMLPSDFVLGGALHFLQSAGEAPLKR